jgi:hypothetical protein
MCKRARCCRIWKQYVKYLAFVIITFASAHMLALGTVVLPSGVAAMCLTDEKDPAWFEKCTGTLLEYGGNLASVHYNHH